MSWRTVVVSSRCMMLSHPQLDSVLSIGTEYVNSLVIEEPGFFRKFLRDITAQMEGNTGEAVLSEENVPIPFSSNAEIIDSILSFRICQKQLINRLTARMEAIAVSEVFYAATAELMSRLEQYIMELSFDLPCDVICSKMSIGGVLRAAGLEVPDDYDSDLEHFLDYMELTRELEKDRLFIFVNLRSFYPDAEMELFFQSVLSHELHILTVDSVSRPCLPSERRVTIDNDLCEF